MYRYLCCDAESLSVTVSLSVSSWSILDDSSVTSDRSRLDTWHRLLVVFLKRENQYANIKNESIVRDMFKVTVHIFGLSWGLGGMSNVYQKKNQTSFQFLTTIIFHLANTYSYDITGAAYTQLSQCHNLHQFISDVSQLFLL